MKHLFVYIFLLFLTGCKFTMEDELITRNCSNSNAIGYTVDVRNSKTFNFILNNLNYLNSPITWQTSAGATLGTSSNGTFSYTFVEGTYIVRALYRNLCGDNVTLSTSTFTISKICAKPTDIRLVSGSNGKYIFNLDGTTTDVASVAWKTTNSANVLVNQITNTNINNFETTVNSTGLYKVTAEITTKCGEKVTYNASFSYSAPVSLVKDIYIGGCIGNQAAYWKNGVPTIISNNPSVIYDIKVFGNDVFAVGKESINGSASKATFWKNGIRITLSNSNFGSDANSLAIQGSDVYVSGSEYDGSKYVAKYWKNNQGINLLSGNNSGGTSGIAVDANNFYIIGAISDNSTNTAKFWKNGIVVAMFNPSINTVVKSIFTLGTDIYISGFQGNKNTYWKNGISSIVSNDFTNSNNNRIFVYGDDIYVLGDGYNGPTYWKNGIANVLPTVSKNIITTSLHVVNNDVYVIANQVKASFTGTLTGWDESTPIFWKNGIPSILSSTPSSGAYSIDITTN